MGKTARRLTVFGLAVAFMFSASGCRQLDVVGNGSVVSFEAVLDAIPDLVEADGINAVWSLSAPDGAARFIWSGDWSKSPLHDVMVEFDATPFLEAGLDPEKLPDMYTYYDDMLIIGVNLGDNALEYSGDPTPLTAYEQIVSLNRDSVGYHMALDHYGVNLGDGNMFEWAKDMSTNDKDIVFVLNPEPLIAAGVDPEAVEGWAFAKVSSHVGGKTVEVDKFLKFFDLI